MVPVPEIDAITKLFEVVLSGVGAVRLLEPWHKKRMARATAEEMKILARAEIDVEKTRLEGKAELEQVARRLLPHSSAVEPVEGEIAAEVEPTFLLTRVHERTQYQEAKRQLNVEQVVVEAANELRGERASEEPVDEDWIARLFGTVQDVSTPQMQKLWAKILAGEVKQPGSFSLRCLDTLKNLSQSEAQLFERLAPYVVNGEFFLHLAGGFERRTGVSFGGLLRLAEAGLLSADAQLHISAAISPTTTVFSLGNLHIAVTSDKERTLQLATFALSGVGVELTKLFRCAVDREYVRALVTEMRQAHYTVKTFEGVLYSESEVLLTSQVDLFPLDPGITSPAIVSATEALVKPLG